MKLQVSIDKPAWTICYHYDGTIVFVHKTINQSTEAICLYINPNWLFADNNYTIGWLLNIRDMQN